MSDRSSETEVANHWVDRGRVLVVLGLVQFVVSVTLLTVANIIPQGELPMWPGILDITLVMTLAVTVYL